MELRMKRLLALACLAALAAPAQSSAPDAWDAHYRQVVRDCLAASKLQQARPEGDLMLFSDAVGTALLVRGKPVGKKKETLLLCIQRRGHDGPPELQAVHDGVKTGPLLKGK
jgi:hypothetical protein